MNNFWKNISRYPRFFISSFIGLILILLTPFKNLSKLKGYQFFLPIFLILIIFFFQMTLKEMTAL